MKKYYITKNKYTPSEGTPMDPVSLTVQGETRTIAELLQRAQQGIPIAKRVYEYIDADINAVSYFNRPNLDLTDLEALNTHIQNLSQSVQTAQLALQQSETDNGGTPDA
jgi:hypothetical protein